MSNKLLRLTTGEAIKLLTKNDFIEVNQVGSHKKFRKDSMVITVPYHSNDKEALCYKLCKAINQIIKQSKSIKL